MNLSTPSPSLIEATVADLKAVAEGIRAERAVLDGRLDDIEGRIADWERIRATVAKNGAPRSRARKGENDRKIAQFYEANLGQGFTLPELAERTGISWSSVRNVVNKNGRSKYAEREGKWFVKRESP